MAYDPHSHYEPPRRAYYGGQGGQQAPAAQQQDYYNQPRQIYNDYEPHDQTYDQNYDQTYDQGYGQGYGQNHGQDYGQEYGAAHAGTYDASYDHSYDQPGYSDPNAYDNNYVNPQSRRYDSGIGGEFSNKPQSRNHRQQHDPRPDPRNQQRRPPGPQSYDDPMQRPRPPPERHYQGNPNQQPRGPDMRNGRPQNSNLQPHRNRPPNPPQMSNPPPRGASRPREQDPQRMTMEEWKAKERAKLHSDKSPQSVPQDNAFPTFPNGKKGPRSGNNSAMSQRSTEEYARPSTSSDHHGRRSDRGRGDSYDTGRPGGEQYASQHAAVSHRDSESSARGDPNGQSYGAPASSQHSSATFHQEAASQVNDQYRHVEHGPAPQTQNAYAYAQDYAAEIQNTYDERPPYKVEPPRPRTATRQPPLGPLDTDFAQQAPRPGYLDHQPMSPANIPPRPSTSHGSRAAVPQSPYEPKSYVQQASVNPRAPQRAMTRDEEIESEMPNFDSNAPAQTSNLHKRIQDSPGDKAVFASPTAAGPSRGHPTSDEGNLYQQAQPPPNKYADFDFGVDTSQGAAFDDAPAPPMAPFATEPPARRSMDDARQMQDRHAPPRGPLPRRPAGQRQPGSNGAPPRGPLPPHMRPEMDRSKSAGPGQGAYGPPGGPRSGSAPPPRQGPLQQQFPPRTGSVQPGAQNLQRPNGPDALPHHPVPVRPGLVETGTPQPARPPPVRNYDNISSPKPQDTPAPAGDEARRPVTVAELQQLRAAVDANPNQPRQALTLVKKLAEANVVLATDGGRADAKTTARNRENYSNEGYKRLKKLVAGGYPEAMFYLADCYGSGEFGIEPDAKEAFTLYQAAAKAGHAQAAFRTAVCCEIGPDEGGGTRKDFPKAVQWYRRAAALGDVAAMYKTGAILLKGLLGQPKNIGEALNWLKRSVDKADAENPHALHEMGLLYEPLNTNPEIRNKVIADEGYARELFQRAAKLGFKPSQFRLGQAYEYGTLGLGIDNRASIAWYSKAAAQGEHQAELALSGWYLTGAEGILQQSDTEAYLWARKAASSEPPLAKAMFAMGYFTEQGIGCPSNLDEARRWYGRAAAYKFPKALERLEELKNVKSGKGKPLLNGKLSRKDQKKDEAECVMM